jgi:hypothetical protein
VAFEKVVMVRVWLEVKFDGQYLILDKR